MNLFDFALKNEYSVYPQLLGYSYLKDIRDNPGTLDEINKYEFVFISSDFSEPIPGCTAKQFMTSAEVPGTYMWLLQEFNGIIPGLHSYWNVLMYNIPTVGFVGRVPFFDIKTPDGGMQKVLHKGFEKRHEALGRLMSCEDICTDFHVRTEPKGDSAGFYNESHPDYIKDGPLFEMNMFANMYQVCARGNANWSLRFFETLSYGRIPVYVESGGMTPADWFYGNVKDRQDELPFVYVENLEDICIDIKFFHSMIWQGKEDLSSVQLCCKEWYHDNYSHRAQIEAFVETFGEARK